MDKKSYADSLQLIVLTALFGTMFYLCSGRFESSGTMLAQLTVSVLTAAIGAIPLAIFSVRSKRGVSQALTAKNWLLGKSAAFLYLIYFLCAASELLKDYSIFTSERYISGYPAVVCVILAGIVCAYISWTGTEAVCRMSSVLALLFVLTAAVFVCLCLPDLNVPEISAEAMTLAGLSGQGVTAYIFAAMITMCFLCKKAGSRTVKGIYIGLAVLLIICAALILGVFSVLGDFTPMTEYPVTDTVIYSSRRLTMRCDGLFYSVWTVGAAAVISLLCSCGADALKELIPKTKGSGLITAGTAAAIAAVSILTDINLCGIIFASPISWIVLLVLFPCCALLLKEKKG